MKFKSFKTSSLVAIAVLFALTAYLFAFNRARRRAKVPALAFTVPRPTFRVLALGFAPTGKGLAIVDGAKNLLFADWKTGTWARQEVSLSPNHGGLSWSRDGQRIYACGQELVEMVEQTKKPSRHVLASVKGDVRRRCNTAMLSANHRFLLCYSDLNLISKPWSKGGLWLRDLQSQGRNKGQLWFDDLRPDSRGYWPRVCGMAFSPDNQTVAVAEVVYGAKTQTTTGPLGQLITQTESYLPLLPTKISLRSIKDGKTLRTISHAPANITLSTEQKSQGGRDAALSMMLTFSPDGRTLAVGEDWRILLFDTKTCKLISSLHSSYTYYRANYKPLVFSPDGRLLAIGRDRIIEVWNVPQARLLQIFFATANNLSFSADGKWLASDDSKMNEQVKIWDVGSLN